MTNNSFYIDSHKWTKLYSSKIFLEGLLVTEGENGNTLKINMGLINLVIDVYAMIYCVVIKWIS